jgi:hypothetical protein
LNAGMARILFAPNMSGCGMAFETWPDASTFGKA